MPEGQAASKARLIRAAGLRWPAEESFELAKASAWTSARPGSTPRSRGMSCSSMAALAICAVTAARLGNRTGTQAPPPAGPDAPPPADPFLIPLTVREVRRLLAANWTGRNRPATPPAGCNGDAAIRHEPAGSTNAHA
jgi:hypothetical protein